MKRPELSLPARMLLGPLLALASAARAETLTLPMNSPDVIESGTAVANFSLGYLHPPLQIQSWDDGSGPQSTAFSIGDGRHGSFNPSTYSTFDSGSPSDSIIEVNTDLYPDLQFSDFRLATGWTLRPYGSSPLLIRTLSTLTVESGARIDCGGEGGGAIGAKTQVSPGGTGRCGGSNGGDGGSISNPATDGASPAGAGLKGGRGVLDGDGGGGGAGLSITGFSAGVGTSASGAVAGAAGTQIANDNFSIVGGGAGGGGGAPYSSGVGESGGGGGGAGGGSIYLYAGGNVSVLGQISANGGAGGGTTGAATAGAGGGGSGGSILLFSRGTITAPGVVETERGLKGASPSSPNSQGGDGSTGRVWAADQAGMTAIYPVVNLIHLGQVTPRSGTFTAVSRLLDLGGSRTRFDAITMDDDGSASLEIAASAEPFAAASAAWQPSSSLLTLSGKRYARFRVTMTAPTRVRSIQFVYGLEKQAKFEFGSCGRVAGGKPESLIFFVLPILLTLWLKRKRLPANA